MTKQKASLVSASLAAQQRLAGSDWGDIIKSTNNKCWQDVEKREPSCTVDGMAS